MSDASTPDTPTDATAPVTGAITTGEEKFLSRTTSGP